MNRLPASIVRIQATIDYIDSHLDDELDIQALAARTEMSFWHFLRVFRATVGETVKDYIRRRRLTRAGDAPPDRPGRTGAGRQRLRRCRGRRRRQPPVDLRGVAGRVAARRPGAGRQRRQAW